jgi:hypothetical protein
MRDPAPVTRERHMIHPRVEHLVNLTPRRTAGTAGPEGADPA